MVREEKEGAAGYHIGSFFSAGHDDSGGKHVFLALTPCFAYLSTPFS